jgi:hypothetical protein
VLAKVTADEANHSELAWRFVQWVISTDAGGLRAVALAGLDTLVENELGSARDAASAPAHDEDAEALAAHGLLSEGVRRELRLRALRDVIAPCAAALRGAHVERPGTSFAPVAAA